MMKQPFIVSLLFSGNDLFCGKAANSGIKWKQSNKPPLRIET